MDCSYILFLSFHFINKDYYLLKTLHIPLLLYSESKFLVIRNVLCVLIIFTHCYISSSQSDDYKIHLQVKINLGSPVNNIGFGIIGEYLGTSGMEVAAGYDLTYNFKNYGIPSKHLEHHLFGTAHYLWGSRETEDQLVNFIKMIDSGSSAHSFGYTMEYFHNNIGTTQRIGTFHYRLNNFILQFGNDLFGHFNMWDQYRTGAVGLGWIKQENYFNMNFLFWTGNTNGKAVTKYREGESEYPARFGYRAMDDAVGGKFSHGILSVGVIRDVGNGQNIGAHLGIDAEQIRNVIQNKIFHDMYFLPSFMDNPKNLHIPMKMEDGHDYLFKEGQKVRNPKLVWQLSLNPNLLY